MENKKSKANIGIIILLIILVIILTFLLTIFIYNKFIVPTKTQASDTKKDTQETTKDNTQTKTVKYNNNQQLILDVFKYNVSPSEDVGTKTLNLEIVNGKLTAYLDKSEVNIKGLEGNIKSFVYNRIGCSIDPSNRYIVVAINDKNELFSANVTGYNRDNYLTFKKVNITEEVVDITELGFPIYFTTCSYIDIAAVLKDNTVKLFDIDIKNNNNDYINAEEVVTISDTDVTNFRYSTYTHMVYSDNTIGKLDLDGKYGKEFDERIKYNNEVLKVSKLYSISKPESDMNYISYVISNNKLYKLQSKVDLKQSKVTNSSVTLVNNSKVKNELVEDTNSEYKDKNVTITFEDGTKLKIENVYIYDAENN